MDKKLQIQKPASTKDGQQEKPYICPEDGA
jgi:hypothetical protein